MWTTYYVDVDHTIDRVIVYMNFDTNLLFGETHVNTVQN